MKSKLTEVKFDTIEKLYNPFLKVLELFFQAREGPELFDQIKQIFDKCGESMQE